MCTRFSSARSEEHTSELQSRLHLVCRLLLEIKIRSEESTFELHLRLPSRATFLRGSYTLTHQMTTLLNPYLFSRSFFCVFFFFFFLKDPPPRIPPLFPLPLALPI